MRLRRATIHDLPALIDLALDSLRANVRVPLVPARDRMEELGRLVLSSSSNFGMVTEIDGAIAAALGAIVENGAWFKGRQATVLMFHARVRGAGLPLLREFARWVRARPGIKLAVFSLEANADPRLAKLLPRIGFTLNYPQFVFARG